MKYPPALPVTILAVLSLFAPSFPVAARQNTAIPDVPQGPNGSVTLLPNGWKLTPAGHAINLPGDMPLGMVLSPDGKFLVVNTGGWHDHDVDVIDLATEKITQRVDVEKNWAGICFNHGGDELYVAGGQGYDKTLLNKGAESGLSPNRLAAMQKSVLRFGWEADYLRPKPSLPVTEMEGKERWTAGVTSGPDDALYVVQMEDDVVYKLSPDTRVTLAFGRVGYRPIAAAISPDGRTVAVANWGDASVSLLDTQSMEERGRVRVGPHPNALVWSTDRRLFVTNTGANTVSVIQGGRVAETIDVGLTPGDLIGTMPDALALSPDGSRLYVADAGSNAVAVVDTYEAGRSRVLGFIPTGWFPSAVAVSADGKKIYVGVGKGMRSRPNVPAIAPDPRTTPGGQRKFDDISRVLSGAVSVVAVPDTAQLAAYTQQARANVPIPPTVSAAASEVDGAVPQVVGSGGPVKHVLYIIREGRTYDQVLGDLPMGNGDSSLALYGRNVTPNTHALAEGYTLFDNLYCNGETAEDGHQWSDAAFATDYTLKAGPGADSGRDEPDADERLRDAPNGDIWDDCAAHGVTFYSYGERSAFTPGPNDTYIFHGDKALIGHASLDWALIPPDRHDDARADVFLKDLRAAEQTGQWPQLVVMSLPEDATHGTTKGQYTPLASIAANDQALGRIIQGVTRSRFWPSTAIFVIESDSRDGPDHVDAHRTVGLIASPYANHHMVDGTLYSTASFLRTIELFLGLPPMTQYDARATPLLNAFTPQPDLAPYKAIPSHVDLETRNP